MHEARVNYVVKVGFDEAEHRYFVLDSDVPGLNVEAGGFEESVEVVRDVAPALLHEQAGGLRIRFEREVVLAA